MIRSVKNFLIGSTLALGLMGSAKAQDGYKLPPNFNNPAQEGRADTAATSSTSGGRGTLDNAYFGLFSRDGRDFARARIGADTDSLWTDVSARALERLGDSPIMLGGSGNLAYGENGRGTDAEHKLLHTDIRLDAGIRFGSGDRTLPQNGIVPYLSLGMTRDERDGDVAIPLETYLTPRAGALVLLGPFQLQAEGGMLYDLGGKTNISSNGQRLDYEGRGFNGRVQLSLDTVRGDDWGLAFQGGLSLEQLTQEISGLRNGMRATQTIDTREIGGELSAVIYRRDGRGFISPFVQYTRGDRNTNFNFQRGDSESRDLLKAGLRGQWRPIKINDNWYIFLDASAAYVHDSAADKKNGYEVILGFGLGHRDSPARRED